MATQKIHFFTGKGGVGKSVISAAYALASASVKTSQILLTELSEESTFSKLFSARQKPANLSLSHWTAQSCLEEYATNLLHSSALSKMFLNNTLSKSLINVAPGLPELAILGKATSSPRKHGPPLIYDEIFIDAFASGHFINLVSVPGSFADIFTLGPMATQSKSIDLWIKNSEFTKVHIVTMCDELSIQESLELYQNLSDLKIKADFILNKYVDTQSLDLKKLPEKTRNFFDNIHQNQLIALSEIKKTKAAVQIIPQVFESQLFKIIQKVAHAVSSKN